jgi:putative transposase
VAGIGFQRARLSAFWVREVAVKCTQIPLVQLTNRKSELLEHLLTVYRDVVQRAVDYAIENNIKSRGKLHERLYRELRAKYPELASHYIYTAFTMALGIVRGFNKRRKSGRVRKEKPEVSRLNTIMLDDYHLFKVVEDVLRLNVGKSYLWLPLKPTEFQKRILKNVAQGCSLSKKGDRWFLNVTYEDNPESFKPEGVLAYDVNEKSLDMLVAKDGLHYIHIDLSEVKHIHSRYQRKRQRIQKLGLRKLLAKYRGREVRRVNHLLHEVSKFVSDLSLEERLAVVTENIKNIRRRIDKGKKLNRRLHSWSFGKLNFQVKYKCEWGGVPYLKPVNASNNSRTCPVCGVVASLRGQVFKCPSCGFEANRHLVACLNILRKANSNVPSTTPSSANALDEISQEWLVATVKGLLKREGEPNVRKCKVP